nr:hypothetical protein [Tanacetum cinerariifolium]
GEGSSTPTEPHHTPSSEADTSHPTTSSIPLPSLPIAPIPPVTQTDTTPIRQYSRRDRATIAKSSTLPHDSAPRVTSPTADEGSMQLTISELTALCTSLQRQHSELLAKFQAQEEVEILRLKEWVQVLEDRESVTAKQSGDDAPIKGRSINEGEATAERISDDSEELARVLTSMDAATVLSGGIDVPTGIGSITTAGPPAADISTGSEVAPTASLIVTSYLRRKDKEVMKEHMRMNEQIAKDAELARIHAEEELQGMIDSLDRSNETISKYLQEYQDFASELPLEKRPMTKKQKRDYYMAMIRNNLGWKVKDFKGMTFEEIEAKFATFWKHVEDFIPMGSKEEAKRLKRKWLNLEQEHKMFMFKPFKLNILSLTGRFTQKDRGATGRSSVPRITSPAADEGSMQQPISELTALCTSLQWQHSELLAKFQTHEVEFLRLKERVQVLEDRESVTAKQSGDDALIKGRNINEREAAAERINDDLEELARVEQIARDEEVARIHAEEELQGMIDSLDRTNETIAKYMQEYQDFASELPLEKRIELISDLVKYQEHYSKVYKFHSQQRRPMTKKQKRDYYMTMIKNNLGWKVKDFKGMTFEEIESKFAAVWKHVEDFIPMGSKEEAERLKRKWFNLEQEHVKKQKTSEETPEIKKSTEEISEEKMKEMM